MRVAALAAGNPAPCQGCAQRARPARGWGADGGAQVALLLIAPAQQGAGAAHLPRQDHAQRARPGQAAQAAAIAGLTYGRFRRGIGVQVAGHGHGRVRAGSGARWRWADLPIK